jgi:hypothetical protein
MQVKSRWCVIDTEDDTTLGSYTTRGEADVKRLQWEAKAIRAWMRAHVSDFVDQCGEVNCTHLVEAWYSECASGGDTLDPNHPAWDCAAEVALWHEENGK